MNNYKKFFLNPELPSHRKYEALRAFHLGRLTAEEAAQKFGMKKNYFYAINRAFYEFLRRRDKIDNPYFRTGKPGPKQRSTDQETRKLIIEKQIVLLKI